MMLFEGLSVFCGAMFFSHLAPSLPPPPCQVVHNFLGGWQIACARMFSNIKIKTDNRKHFSPWLHLHDSFVFSVAFESCLTPPPSQKIGIERLASH